MNLKRFLTYFIRLRSTEPEQTSIYFRDGDGRNLEVERLDFIIESNAWEILLRPAPRTEPAPQETGS